MFLRAKTRTKDGKTHRYWNVVENRRVHDGRVLQRDLLYLGEINDAQHAIWVRAIDALGGADADDDVHPPRQLALLPEDREAPPSLTSEAVHVQLDKIELLRPRQWGAAGWPCTCGTPLDRFWAPLLPESRKGTRWLNVLKALACYRLIDPGNR